MKNYIRLDIPPELITLKKELKNTTYKELIALCLKDYLGCDGVIDHIKEVIKKIRQEELERIKERKWKQPRNYVNAWVYNKKYYKENKEKIRRINREKMRERRAKLKQQTQG